MFKQFLKIPLVIFQGQLCMHFCLAQSVHVLVPEIKKKSKKKKGRNSAQYYFLSCTVAPVFMIMVISCCVYFSPGLMIKYAKG